MLVSEADGDWLGVCCPLRDCVPLGVRDRVDDCDCDDEVYCVAVGDALDVIDCDLLVAWDADCVVVAVDEALGD